MKISVIPIIVILSVVFIIIKNIFGKKDKFTYDKQWEKEENTFVNKQNNLELEEKVQINEAEDKEYKDQDLAYENEEIDENMVNYQGAIDDEEKEIQEYLDKSRKEYYEEEPNEEIVDIIKIGEINNNRVNYKFDKDDLIKGIVMSEILSKPKSLRK
ncbi:hypothetical protein [Dethiothermospora halolimnae]|uniref:hypothetical protein n=1 Tax=Dethiothermospora halolimnae TaxID=3114390 RepID=UPI003CCC2E46